MGLLVLKKISYYYNMIPLSFKMILGFALICMIIISLMTVAAIINRPRQIQQLEAYEQKLTNISTHKVSEEHFATGSVNVNIRMYNFDDVQCTVIPSVAYGFVTGMNLQLC